MQIGTAARHRQLVRFAVGGAALKSYLIASVIPRPRPLARETGLGSPRLATPRLLLYVLTCQLLASLIIDSPSDQDSHYICLQTHTYIKLPRSHQIVYWVSIEDLLKPSSCYLDIMSDALCGPSNALQNFQKHASVDRTLQQDRLVSRQSHSQVSFKPYSTSMRIPFSTILRSGLRSRAFGHKIRTKVS